MSRFRILIAEDSRVQASLVLRHLETQHECVVVENGQQAVHALKASHYHFLILDIVMPELDGFGVLNQLNQSHRPDRVIVITSQTRASVESKAISLGADYLLTKPLDWGLLDILIAKYGAALTPLSSGGQSSIKTQEGMPWRIKESCCYICGYQHVPVYQSISEAYEEDWKTGFFPIYRPKNGYQNFDLFKVMISVCPYCLFASSDVTDFAETATSPFPYLTDAKKILARTMVQRKKMLAEINMSSDVFIQADRKKEDVMMALHLGEKCMNGLLMGEKPGGHYQLGFYQVMLGAIDKVEREKYFTSAIENFENQLRRKEDDEELFLRCVYFLAAIHIWRGESSSAKPLVQEVGVRYSDQNEKEIEPNIQLWLRRITSIWNNGVDREAQREMM